MLIFASDKDFGLFDIVSRVLEGNTSVGRKVAAFCIFIATICGIYFLCLGRAVCVPFCFHHVLGV